MIFTFQQNLGLVLQLTGPDTADYLDRTLRIAVDFLLVGGLAYLAKIKCHEGICFILCDD
jgi:hypothetical protein